MIITQQTAMSSGHLDHGEIEHIRRLPNRSMLLFITDRCPVGCAHCSVDSLADSPKITDFELFTDIVDWISGQSHLDIVAISGGEPFVERRGLDFATKNLKRAGKRVVVFTSGVWAKKAHVPLWIKNVLGRTDTVYLSTDAFHAEGVDDESFIRAARIIAQTNCWLIVQALDQKGTRERVERMMEQALGKNWGHAAEINYIKPLENGRGKSVFNLEKQYTGSDVGSCHIVRNPMIRYDGQVSACCNEGVIKGFGPPRLRRKIDRKEQIGAAIAEFGSDSMLKIIGGIGLGALTEHPRYSDFSDAKVATTCELCWKMLGRQSSDPQPDNLLNALAALPAGADND